jgi:hypothetical protein
MNVPKTLSVVRLSDYTYFFQSAKPLVGQGFLIIETLLSHSDISQSVGLLWVSDRPEAVTT